MSERLISLYTYAVPWSSIKAFSTLKMQAEEHTGFCKKAKVIAVGIIASIGAAIAGALTLGLAMTPTFRWIVSLFYPLQGLRLNNAYIRQNLEPPAPPPRHHFPKGAIHRLV